MSSSFALPALWNVRGYSERTNACVDSLKRTSSTRWSSDLAKSCQVIPSALSDSILHTQGAFREGAEATKVVMKHVIGKATQSDSVGEHLKLQTVHLVRSLMHLAQAGICIVLLPVLVAKPRLVVPLHHFMGLEGLWGLPAGGAAYQLARLVAASKDYAEVGVEKLKNHKTVAVLLVSVAAVIGLGLVISGKKPPSEGGGPSEPLSNGFCPNPPPIDIFQAFGIPKPQPQSVWNTLPGGWSKPLSSNPPDLPNNSSVLPSNDLGSDKDPVSVVNDGKALPSTESSHDPLDLSAKDNQRTIPSASSTPPSNDSSNSQLLGLLRYASSDNMSMRLISGIALVAVIAVGVVVRRRGKKSTNSVVLGLNKRNPQPGVKLEGEKNPGAKSGNRTGSQPPGSSSSVASGTSMSLDRRRNPNGKGFNAHFTPKKKS